MKKLFSILFALLLVASITGVAVSHQATYQPKTTDGGAYITVPVYAAAALDAGDVVVWDVASSTGDNDMWVASTTTADTGAVAGVVWPSAIAAGGEGSIVIWGLAECDLSATGASEGAPICTSTTAGAGENCASATAGHPYAIVSTTGGASAQTKCMVDVR